MTLENIKGFIRFQVEGQAALSPWAQRALQNALKSGEAPEELRFQCRIATDARKNFELIELPDGETLTLHSKARPQFGKNHRGHAYLTTTLVYSGDGQAYTFRWVGDAVPLKMQQIAVKHDMGKATPACMVRLDLDKASITPAWKTHHKPGPSNSTRSKTEEKRTAAERRAAGKPRVKRATRRCERMTQADLEVSA